MFANYQAIWQTYRQRVSQAEAVLQQTVLAQGGTDGMAAGTLERLYEAVTGVPRATLCRVGGVTHPADALAVSHCDFNHILAESLRHILAGPVT